MKQIESLRDRLRAQISELQQQLAGVEMSLRAVSGEIDRPVTAPRAARTNVKQILLHLLDEVGASGLNAAKAVELAGKRNEQIERATASSLLSRFKSDGVVTYDGTNYKLTKFSTGTNNDQLPMH